jgi:hypothetical protein
MRFRTKAVGLSIVSFAISVAGCRSEAVDPRCGLDASVPITMEPDASVAMTSFVQVDYAGRPGINGLLLANEQASGISNQFAPSFMGAVDGGEALIAADAKTTLKALYYGTCLINGAVGLTAATGLKPAAQQCQSVGTALFSDANRTTVSPATVIAAQAYADKVYEQFAPDVMRIDTSLPSAYLTLCGDGASRPLLCGGRTLSEDTIDITYGYLFAGLAIPKGVYSQFTALVSDGVNFSADDSQNQGNGVVSTGIANSNQYHPPVTSAFPYAPPPF